MIFSKHFKVGSVYPLHFLHATTLGYSDGRVARGQKKFKNFIIIGLVNYVLYIWNISK